MNIRMLTLALALPFSLGAGASEFTEIQDLNTQTTELRTQLAELKRKLANVEMTAEMERNARYDDTVGLDPATGKYQIYHDEMVNLAMAVTSATTRADGVQLVLNIGNPSTATLRDLSANIDYGLRRGDQEDYAAWASRLQHIKLKLDCIVKPASWNPCTLQLPGIKPDALGYVGVSQFQYQNILFSK